MPLKKKPTVTAPGRRPGPPERLKIPVIVLFRAFVLGAVAVIACIWALVRYYHAPRMPMLRPVPSASAHEIDIEP